MGLGASATGAADAEDARTSVRAPPQRPDQGEADAAARASRAARGGGAHAGHRPGDALHHVDGDDGGTRDEDGASGARGRVRARRTPPTLSAPDLFTLDTWLRETLSSFSIDV
jgi:hypothetical protein